MPAETKVLLIDDDERLNALVTTYLGRFGFAVRAFTHPQPGLRALKSEPPDIVVLDVMLPDMDGFAVCRRIRELVARMQAVLRRDAKDANKERVCIGALEVNWATRSAHLKGRDLILTTAEFELLSLLVRNRSRVLSRDRIINETRGIDWEAYDRSIDVLISRLRQKLGDDPRSPAFIRTVRGVGYLFIGAEQ